MKKNMTKSDMKTTLGGTINGWHIENFSIPSQAKGFARHPSEIGNDNTFNKDGTILSFEFQELTRFMWGDAEDYLNRNFLRGKR